MDENIKQNIKSLLVLILSIVTIFMGILLTSINLELELWIQICISTLCIIIGIALILFKIANNITWTKISLICCVLAIAIIIIYIIILNNGWIKYFKSAESIKSLILSTGIWGQLVFLILQFLQVVILPIPAIFTTLAGTAIFGPLIALIISTIGIILGSIVSFVIGRLLGRPLVVWVAGEKDTKKYCDLLNEKGKFMLPVMFLLPVFPDDILCLIAGITSMTFKYFILSTILVRPISIIITCFIGSGEIIPFSGWGLIVWPILIVFLAIAFYLIFKYQSKIEQYFIKKFNKRNINNTPTKKETVIEKNSNNNNLNNSNDYNKE